MNARTRVAVLSWIAVAALLVDVVIFSRAAHGGEREEFKLDEFLAEQGLDCPRSSDFECAQLVDALEEHDNDPTPYDLPCVEEHSSGRICITRRASDGPPYRNEAVFSGP